MRRTLAAMTAVAVVSTTGAAAAYASKGHLARVACTGTPTTAQALTVPVAGEMASGFYAVPRHQARGVVVFDHGYSHTAWNWREHLTQVAARDGVIAVAMDYRHQKDSAVDPKTGFSSSRGWRVQEGADDSIAAAKLFDRACKTGGVNSVYGISMGGNTSGLVAAAAAKRTTGKPLFDYWFAIEPAVNVTETWAEASLVAQSGNTFAVQAAEDIEQEMGGTPADAPASYQSHTVMARIGDIAAAGLRGVTVVQGVDDGLVPYNQSRELV